MRVLQINAVYKTKSTGRIMMEMHKYFQSRGIESYAAYATENTDTSADPNVFRIGSTLDHKIHAAAYRIDNMQGCHSVFATKKLINKIKSLKPDVVLTHNLHSNYVHVPMLFKALKDLNIAVVPALHDCWFLTGGCYHYTASGCDKWKNGCAFCAKLGSAAEKKYRINCEMFDYVRPTVVATSKWIEGQAKQSLLAKRSDIVMIYDWIDMQTFRPKDGGAVRKKLGLGEKTMILGVSAGWSADKGSEEMTEIALAMPDAAVVLVGAQPKNAQYPENVITIPFTDSKEELSQLYSAADVFFNPSKQETFGLVSGEALSCGTPLVVYNTTACPEFVTEYTGVVMENRQAAVSAVREVLEKNKKYERGFISEKCAAFAAENFSMERNIDRYIELFEKISKA